MAKIIYTLTVLLALTFGVYTRAQSGDICTVRPDLCDDNADANHSVENTRNPSAKSGTNFAQKAVHRPSSQRPTAKCRMPGAAYNLEQSNLPLCTSRSRQAAQQAAPQQQVATRAGAARAPANMTVGISYEDYLASNASHPALSGKITDHQKAFTDAPRTAVITFPVESGVDTTQSLNGTLPAANQAAPNAAAAGAAPGAAAGGLPANSNAAAAAAAAYLAPGGTGSSNNNMPNNR